jgi:hypothetical protein
VIAPASRSRLSSLVTVRLGFFDLRAAVATAWPRRTRGDWSVVDGSALSSEWRTWPSRPSTITSSAEAGAAAPRLHRIPTKRQQANRMTPMTPMLGSKLRREVRCNSKPMRLRSLLPLVIALLALGLVAGCGGDSKEADSSTDVDQLLKDTFSGKKDIKSGKIDVALNADSGDQTFAVKVSGPFESQGTGKLPKLDIDASLEGAGQSFQAGVTSTGDQGFVSYGGTDYAVPASVFQQFKAGFEQSAKQAGGKSDQSLTSLGIDPSKWLTNAQNAGEAKVGDTDTIKITGDVDVPKLLDDVNAALQKLRTIGGSQASQLPDQLSEQDKKQATDAIKDLSVEIYTGAEDKIMRRIAVAMKLDVPNSAGGGTQAANLKFDLQLLDLNEGQEIKAPENTKPFTQLMSKLQGLGLGGLSVGGGTTGGKSGSGSAGASQENLEKYSQCIQDANGDTTKIRKCADLLTP